MNVAPPNPVVSVASSGVTAISAVARAASSRTAVAGDEPSASPAARPRQATEAWSSDGSRSHTK